MGPLERTTTQRQPQMNADERRYRSSVSLLICVYLRSSAVAFFLNEILAAFQQTAADAAARFDRVDRFLLGEAFQDRQARAQVVAFAAVSERGLGFRLDFADSVVDVHAGHIVGLRAVSDANTSNTMLVSAPITSCWSFKFVMYFFIAASAAKRKIFFMFATGSVTPDGPPMISSSRFLPAASSCNSFFMARFISMSTTSSRLISFVPSKMRLMRASR